MAELTFLTSKCFRMWRVEQDRVNHSAHSIRCQSEVGEGGKARRREGQVACLSPKSRKQLSTKLGTITDLNLDAYTTNKVKMQAFREHTEIQAWKKFIVRPDHADLLQRRVVFRKALAQLLSKAPVSKYFQRFKVSFPTFEYRFSIPD